MVELKYCKTVGEMMEVLQTLPTDARIGISYSKEDGPGETLLVELDQKKEYVVGLDFMCVDREGTNVGREPDPWRAAGFPQTKENLK